MTYKAHFPFRYRLTPVAHKIIKYDKTCDKWRIVDRIYNRGGSSWLL